jgi:hypothetical protein
MIRLDEIEGNEWDLTASRQPLCVCVRESVCVDIDCESLQSAVLTLCSRLQRCEPLLPRRLTKSQLRYLECSAVEEGVPELVFEIIRDKLLRDDSRKLRMLLFLMNLSFGNLIVTGFPTPFKVLTTTCVGHLKGAINQFKIRYHSYLSEHGPCSSRDSAR